MFYFSVDLNFYLLISAQISAFTRIINTHTPTNLEVRNAGADTANTEVTTNNNEDTKVSIITNEVSSNDQNDGFSNCKTIEVNLNVSTENNGEEDVVPLTEANVVTLSDVADTADVKTSEKLDETNPMDDSNNDKLGNDVIQGDKNQHSDTTPVDTRFANPSTDIDATDIDTCQLDKLITNNDPNDQNILSQSATQISDTKEHIEIVSNKFEAIEEKKIETYQRTINLEETCVESVQSKQLVTSQNETSISTKTHEKQEYSENMLFSSTHQERSNLEEQRINEVDSKCDSIDLNKIHNEKIRAPNSPSLGNFTKKVIGYKKNIKFCLKVQKWTQTDTNVTFHPTHPPENFFWCQMKGMAKIRLFYSCIKVLILS